MTRFLLSAIASLYLVGDALAQTGLGNPPAIGYMPISTGTGPGAVAWGNNLTANYTFSGAGGSGQIVSTTAAVDLHTVIPTNGFFASNAGAVYNICPLTGCNAGDHLRAAVYTKSTAVLDATIGEYMVGVDANLNSGLSPPWAQSTLYATNAFVVGNGGVNVYKATVGGTSSNMGTGPSGMGGSISDGTVTWAYAGPSFNSAKVGFFISAVTGSNSSYNSWGMANDFVIGAGDTGQFKVGAEFDATNNAADCAVGVKNCYNIYLSGNPVNPLTATIGIAPSGSVTNAHYAILINGAHAADTVDIENSGSAAIGFCNGCLQGSIHTIAGIRENSLTPIGINLTGTYATAAINLPTGTTIIAQGGLAALGLVSVASAVNHIQLTQTATAGNPVVGVAGSDSNINLDLTAKGTGLIDFNAVTRWVSPTSFTATGAQAVTPPGSTGVSGHGTIQEWFTIVNNNGVVRYLAAY